MHQTRVQDLGRDRVTNARMLRINGLDYFVRGAMGEDNNCLIDTLRQQIPGLIANLNSVRELLHNRFPYGPNRVLTGRRANYLELQAHWRSVLEFLGVCAEPRQITLRPENYRIICVDLEHLNELSTVAGDGDHTLYIAREHGNHFVPLGRLHSR